MNGFDELKVAYGGRLLIPQSGVRLIPCLIRAVPIPDRI